MIGEKYVEGVLHEFKKTERNFVRDCILLEKYVNTPIVTRAHEWGSNPAAAKYEIVPVKEVIKAHEAFLCDLEACTTFQEVCRAFIQHSSKLKDPMARYYQDKDYYDQTNTKVAKLQQFKQKCENEILEKEGIHQTVINLSMGPIQRMMRYPVLFDELWKHVDDNNIDIQCVNDARRIAVSILESIQIETAPSRKMNFLKKLDEKIGSGGRIVKNLNTGQIWIDLYLKSLWMHLFLILGQQFQSFEEFLLFQG
ncbi:MAG: RhoGEF domain [Bacteroidota bacterium]|jgi:hypothetical protein